MISNMDWDDEIPPLETAALLLLAVLLVPVLFIIALFDDEPFVRMDDDMSNHEGGPE